MKQITKFMSLLVGALCLVLLPKATALSASAATYQLKFNDNENKWYFIEGDSWIEGEQGSEVYYLNAGKLNDGDTVVINCSDDEKNITKTELTLNASLGNLTFSTGAFAAVHATSVTECYICDEATGAVNCNVTNAYVYNTGVAQFNGSVSSLYVLSDNSEIQPTVACTGTVGYLKIDCTGGALFEYYSFKSGSLKIEDGLLKTGSEYYSASSSASTESTATAAATTTTTSTAAAGEYDDVPKTGESQTQTAVILLLVTALVCMGGSLFLRKRTAR